MQDRAKGEKETMTWVYSGLIEMVMLKFGICAPVVNQISETEFPVK